MNKKSIYLCGTDTCVPENQINNGLKSPINWKNYVAQSCLKNNIQVLNHLTDEKNILNSNGRVFISEEERSRKEVEKTLNAVEKSNFIFANLCSPDPASWIPLIQASKKGKTTIAWASFPISPWVASYTNAAFENINDAIEYLLSHSQHDDLSSILDWSIQYESILKEHSEVFPIHGEAGFDFIPSNHNKPVLCISPHATSYWSNGVFREAESYTGALSVALNKLADIHSIISSYCNPENALYPSNNIIYSPMLSFIEQFIKINNLKFIVIFRSMPWENEKQIKIINHSNNIFNSDSVQSFLTSLVKISGERDVKTNIQNTEEEQTGLPLLSKHLETPILEIFIHKTFLMPQMNKINYHNLAITLQSALNNI